MDLRKAASTLLFTILVAGISGTAKAEPKPWYWSWWPSHWENQDFKPYLEDSKPVQNLQWDDKKWEPADWAAQSPNGNADVIEGFYKAHILHKQYVRDHIAVLEVGPSFYQLSGYDKRRVMRVVDDVYQITTSHENGMFTLADWKTHKPIGLYTARGLQLQ